MTRARSLSKLVNAQSFTVDSDFNVGVNSTSPEVKLDVVGVVSATSFFGDGSNLEGVASAGLGTAISDTAPGDVIYYTNTTLGINTDITVDHPTTSNVSFPTTFIFSGLSEIDVFPSMLLLRKLNSIFSNSIWIKKNRVNNFCFNVISI